jgi:hypothetical protein
MVTCECCREDVEVEDAVVVGEPLEYEYWCALCVEIWNSWL